MLGCSGLAYPWTQSDRPPQGAHNRMVPGLSWITRLRGRNELSGQLSERHAFKMTRRPPTMWSLINTDRINIANPTPFGYKIMPGLHLDNTPWLFFTIANIANRALVSTYFLQVIGNHPTSTGISMAKYIFDLGPTYCSRYISGQGSSMHKVFPINSYNLMHQT